MQSGVEYPSGSVQMSQDHALSEQHVPDHLTAIKLAIQALDRRADLSDGERHLAQMAMDATNRLTADLLQPRDTGPTQT